MSQKSVSGFHKTNEKILILGFYETCTQTWQKLTLANNEDIWIFYINVIFIRLYGYYLILFHESIANYFLLSIMTYLLLII